MNSLSIYLLVSVKIAYSLMSESRLKTLIMNRDGSLQPELEKMRATRHLKAEDPYFWIPKYIK